MNIKVDTSEVTNWINNQPNRNRAKVFFLNAVGNKIQREVQTEAGKISVTNTLKNSTSYKVIGDERVDIYSAGYGGIALETGRRPGSQPPTEALRRWARLKLGDENAAYAVARKIAAQGTRKHQTKGPKQLTEIENRLMRVLSTDFDKFLDEYTK